MSYRLMNVYCARTRRIVGEIREDLVGGLAWGVYVAGRPGVHSGGFSRGSAVEKLAALAGYAPEELEV